MTKYNVGLIISPRGKKFFWELEENVDVLSCEIREFHTIEASSKTHAVRVLNEDYWDEDLQEAAYGGRTISRYPFRPGQGWW